MNARFAVFAIASMTVLAACGQSGEDGAVTEGYSKWRLTETQVRDLLTRVGVPARQHDFMVCIARNESNFDPAAINDENDDGSTDYGLFQINSFYWPSDTAGGPCASSGKLTSSSLENAKCAKIVLSSAPWYGEHWATYSMCSHLYNPG